MSDRAQQLHDTADRQIAQLTEIVSRLDQSTVRRPCEGREKLGDGTVAASAQHTADNYQRIAGFIHASDRMQQRIARELAATTYHASCEDWDTARPTTPIMTPARGTVSNTQPTALTRLLKQLGAIRASMEGIAKLTDRQLDSIPPDGSFRFCDGRRALEQVLAGLLKHQEHQLQALAMAINS